MALRAVCLAALSTLAVSVGGVHGEPIEETCENVVEDMSALQVSRSSRVMDVEASAAPRGCPVPAETMKLTSRGCPPMNCYKGNTNFPTFKEAWEYCGRQHDCGFISKWTNGMYYPRRADDPEDHAYGAAGQVYSCPSSTPTPSYPGGGEGGGKGGKGTTTITTTSHPYHYHFTTTTKITTTNSNASPCPHPTTEPNDDCPVPAEDWGWANRGCPRTAAGCWLNNTAYGCFSDAWKACGKQQPLCKYISRWTDGKYYLRRASDPKHYVKGAAAMMYDCPGATLIVPSFSKYPGYTGNDVVEGHVTIRNPPSYGKHPSQTLTWDLTGVPKDCDQPSSAANSCGIHIHEGTNCDDAATIGGHLFVFGIHYWGFNASGDPWERVRYAASQDGSSSQTKSVRTGLSVADITHRVVVVHAKDGSRIACGVITP